MLVRKSNLRSRPRGFTLVELLIVVVIISILAAIALRVYGALVVGARVKATQATIKKIQGLVDERVRAFNRYMEGKSQASPGTRDELAVMIARVGNSDATGTPPLLLSKGMRTALGSQTLLTIAFNDTKRARLMAQKELYRQLLPQSWDDQTTATPAANVVSAGDSSELLYLALSANAVYGVPPLATDYFSTNELTDTDGDGLLEFVDGWGQPLRFYRWPTLLTHPTSGNVTGTAAIILAPPSATPASTDPIRLNSAQENANARMLITALPSNNSLYLDPDDRLGLTSKSFWSGRPFFIANFHGLLSYHVPLIVSAGQDGFLGLYEPLGAPLNGAPNPGGQFAAVQGGASLDYLTDNLTNLNTRAGGN